MLIPIDADAAVVQSFEASVECDVLPDAVFVFTDEMLDAAERRFFFDCEDIDEIRFRLDSCFIECADRCKNRFDVASVVADARGIYLAVTNLGFDLQARLKDRVEVSVEHYGLCAANAFADSNEVAFCVVVNLVELASLE